MPVTRYNKRKILQNSNDIYKEQFENRGIRYIEHYNTAVYKFDDSQKNYSFDFVERIWKQGDMLYKYSYQYYNSVEYWWVIAAFNQKPTDYHFTAGDRILIPYPLEDVLTFLGVY